MEQSGTALFDGKGPYAVLFPYSSSLLVGARAIKKAAAVPRLPPRFGSKQSFSLAGFGSLRPGALSAFFDLSLRSPLRRLATLAAFPSTGRHRVGLHPTRERSFSMKLTTLVEITRIRQEVREPDVALEMTHITSP